METKLTNLKAVERFDQAYGARIDKLFWIAGSFNNSDFKEFMEDLEDKEYKHLFPEITNGKHFKEYRKEGDEMEMLVDYNKFGLIAEIHVPEASDFRFKGKSKKPWAWGVHGGICKIKYAYGETTEELMTAIEKAAQECWDYDLKKALKN